MCAPQKPARVQSQALSLPLYTYVRMCFDWLVMETIDALGRRRQPGQNRGLRPLFPRLPESFDSRVVRIAMTRPAWSRLDTMLAEDAGATRPRAFGELLERMLARLDVASAISESAPSRGIESSEDWQDWQMRKERMLLSHTDAAI